MRTARPAPLTGKRVLGRATVAALAASTLTSVLIAPAGDPVERLSYLQAPLAVVAFAGSAVVLIASVAHLRTGSASADRLAAAAAETGFAFALLAALVGALWSQAAEHRWWTSDPLAGTIAVLAAVYGGYLAIRRLQHNPDRTARWAAVAGLAAFPAVAGVYASIAAWRPVTLEAQLIRPAPTAAAIACLVLGTAAFAVCFLHLTGARVQLGNLEERARRDAWASVRHRPAPRVVPGRARPGVGARA
jgi:heme exporter protein C